MTRFILAVACALLLVGSAGLLGSSAGAQPGGPDSESFNVIARADSTTVEIVDPSAPLVSAGQLVFLSPGTAQAAVNSAGGSRAFASAPYAGDFVVNLPGTINGLEAGKAPPLPTYPFIVTSEYPIAPMSQQTQGPYGLEATSDENTSSAQATVGIATGSPTIATTHSTATSSRDPSTGTVSAAARTTTQAFSIGSLLTLGDVTATATLTAEPGEPVTKRTAFSVGSMTLAGVPIGLTDKGLQAGNNALPVRQLSAGGATVDYLPSTQTATSIESGGLAITYRINVPGQGLIRTTLTLGRVSATTQAANISDQLPDISSAGPTNLGPGPVSAAGTLTSGALPSGGSAASPPALGTRLPRQSGHSASTVLSAGPMARFTIRDLYLALVAAGALLLAGGRLVGLLGVGLRAGHDHPPAVGAGPVLRLPPE